MFPMTSRYHNIEITKLTAKDGREIPYLRRRFLPTSRPTVLTEHQVTQSDRLDNITAQYLGDPEQFWRLADANLAMHPEQLTAEIGRRLKIPLIQGG
ncbi:MAG: hypothetical protein RLP02_32165 [Coleofasciculus sp. C2-GNP5-27]